MATVDKELLEHLTKLSRLELGKQGAKLLKDVEATVSYFEQIASVDTKGLDVSEGDGGARNVVRDDAYVEALCLDNGQALRGFPESDSGYLQVPQVQ